MKNAETPITAEIRALEERMLDAFLQLDPDELARHLAPEFREIGCSGRIFSRDEVLAAARVKREIDYVIEDFATTELTPTLVLATFHVTRTDRTTGERARSVRSSIWRLTDGARRIVFHQGTRTPA